MLEWNAYGDYPQIDKASYIHPSAVVIGKVVIGSGVFVAPGAVIRADEEESSIMIADHCNIQDHVVIHALSHSRVELGERTSLSHGCIVHGPCKIGKDCFVGFNSVIFNAELEDRVFVKFMAGALDVHIPAGRVIPNGTVVDTPAKSDALLAMPKDLEVFSHNVLKANAVLLKGYHKEV